MPELKPALLKNSSLPFFITYSVLSEIFYRHAARIPNPQRSQQKKSAWIEFGIHTNIG